jgi:predicted Co/Zn/Cd cation transporter (cation efflux family)
VEIVAGILFGVGGAFAFKLAKVSIGIFAVVIVLGLIAGLATEYKDMIFYGIVAVILMILSVVAHKRVSRESGHSSY